jgi:DNA-binding transcriptional MocR family regulator
MSVNSFDDYPMSWRPARAALASGPLYLALAAALERDVRAGALPAGTRLPPQRELADFLDVDFTTVTRAYNVCRAKGLVYGVVGRGTFVADAGEGVADGTTPKDVIDLGVVQAFPEIGAKSVVAAARTVLSRETATRLFTYDDRDGKLRHRVAGCRWLARCGVEAKEDLVSVFPGVQGAISTALLAAFNAGDAIAVDPFTYANLVSFARLSGTRLVPIENDEDGMLPEALDEAAAKRGVKGVFVMPNCANPTTRTLSEKRKDELAEVMARRGLLVLEDDASLDMRSRGTRDPTEGRSSRQTFQARIPKQVIYLSGTTRLISPGLRTAFVCAPRSVHDRLVAGLHHAAIKASALDAEILGELILSDEAEKILAAKAHMAAKANAIFDRVFKIRRAGDEHRLFRTMPLPGTSGRGQEIERQFLDAGVRVFHSDRYAVVRGAKDSFVRVSLCSAGSLSRLAQGLERLRGTQAR